MNDESDKTTDVWVEAKLEFNDLSVKGLLKAALSILSAGTLENDTVWCTMS